MIGELKLLNGIYQASKAAEIEKSYKQWRCHAKRPEAIKQIDETRVGSLAGLNQPKGTITRTPRSMLVIQSFRHLRYPVSYCVIRNKTKKTDN